MPICVNLLILPSKGKLVAKIRPIYVIMVVILVGNVGHSNTDDDER